MNIISNAGTINAVARGMVSHREAYAQSSIGGWEIDGAGMRSDHDRIAHALSTLLNDWADSLACDADSLRNAAHVFQETDEALAWMISH